MKIMISGGGIAGMTAANLLHAQGHEVIVLDKARQFTNSGFLLSLKSFGVDILSKMGLEDELRKRATIFEYVDFMEPNGHFIRQVSYATLNQKLSKSIFATRAAIHDVIYNSVADKVQILMNTTIIDCIQENDSIKVSISDGQAINVDLLIIAEGLHSTTRKKLFSNVHFEDLSIFYLGGRLQKKHGYKLGVFKWFLGVGKLLAVLPLSENEIALHSYIRNNDNTTTLQGNAKALLISSFSEFDNEVQILIREAIEQGVLFTDKMGTIHLENLVNGRAILLGDAGYCPTALSGMGASLSIYGAKALSYFIEKYPEDIHMALRDYNEIMQPIIAKFQRNAKRTAVSLLPRSAGRHWLTSFMIRLAPRSFITNRMSKEFSLTEAQRIFL
jgi:2-polyprenyl-6-methoxyphenol hydroxylase-like FAD-dependent oxidoreductase